jgi:hypothetical protein
VALTYMEETTLKAVAARQAIGEVTARHNRAAETGDLHGWLSTFLPEGVLERPGSDPLVGHRALGEYFRSLPGDRVHVVTDAVIDVDGVTARQGCRFLVLQAGSNGSGVTVEAAGRYQDDFVFERGDWYLARRLMLTDLPSGR